MKNTKSVLLVFEDTKELAATEACLIQNGFFVHKSVSLDNALHMIERLVPNMIVVNTFDSEYDLELFSHKLGKKQFKNISLLRLIELEMYLKTSLVKEHVIVKPVQPTLLLSLIKNRMIYKEGRGLFSLT